MNLPQTGGCLCGKIRYEITEEPQLVYTCHCVDCQRLTSSAFSMGIVVPDRAFRLTGVEPRQLSSTLANFRDATQHSRSHEQWPRRAPVGISAPPLCRGM
jgi:hypothetical protein